MSKKRITKRLTILEKAKREDGVDKIIDEAGRIGYIIYKPVNGKRRILVFGRVDKEHLKQPVEAWVEADLSETDLAVIDYIIQSVCRKTPRLLPLVLENKSMRRMCRYFLLYRSGSIKTLWVYVYCIHNFCEFMGKTPDRLMEEAKRDPEALKRHREKLEEFLGAPRVVF